MPFPRQCIVLLACFVIVPVAEAAESDYGLPQAQAFLTKHCADCHGKDSPEAGIALIKPKLGGAEDAAVWQRVLTQVASGEMPPDTEARPQLAEREAVIHWILEATHAAGFPAQLPGGPLPQDGNWIDHELLFSGRHTGPASSPPRYWRRSQPQYDALMEELWVIPKFRYEKAHQRNKPEWAAYSYSQPFPELDPAHFTNYAGSVHADEAVLRALLDAGSQIAERLTSEKTAYARELQPPIAVGIPSVRRGSPWEKFLQEPPPRPMEFEPFLLEGETPSAEQQVAAVSRVFEMFLNREPNGGEAQRYGELLAKNIEKNGPLAALRGLITAVLVSPEYVFRMEIGLGPTDETGRRLLAPQELLYALGFALSDEGPDSSLREAAAAGKLRTRADAEREIRRLLAEDSVEKHTKLRFFQEFFGYHRAGDVFKDKPGWEHEVNYLIRDADMFVEHILERDRDVFAQLLTYDRYFVAYPHIPDPELFAAIRENTLEETKAAIEKARGRGQKIEPNRLGGYNRSWAFTQGFGLIPRTVHNDRGSFEMSYIAIYGIEGATFDWTPNQPIALPGRRAGILTHPAWLVAHSTNFDNSIVARGHWIRENLLAGKIPDVPLDVEAQVPEEPESTLRERMRVTQAERCIRCHRRMDPLGTPFEIYDHHGRFREQEMVFVRQNIPKPIDARGAILASGEAELDGPVEDAIALVHKLAASPRVRQSFVRHAFRFWMGRNEQLSDSPTLIAADEAYVNSGGSFNELLVALLTSDSFLYRK